MARSRIQIAPHLSDAELIQNYKECQDGKLKSYWQVIQLLNQQDTILSVEEIAEIVGFSSDWVRKLAHRYNRLGPAGLSPGHRASQKNQRRLAKDPHLVQPNPVP